MNSLELFSGSGIVSEMCRLHGFDAWSVDINKKYSPRICCNILDLEPDQLPGQFSFIWASPDCRYFSRNHSNKDWLKINIGYRRYRYIPLTDNTRMALALVYKTIDIIKNYPGCPFVIENPVGRLRHVPVLNAFAPYRYSINYKDWGFDYSKETDLYTNILLPFQTKKVQRFGKSVSNVNSRFKRSIVPFQLVKFILNSIIH